MAIDKEDVITVNLKTDEIYRFKLCSKGLYYFDTDILKVEDTNKNTVTKYSLLQTANNNKEYFTTKEIKGVDKSREHLYPLSKDTLEKIL